MKTTKLTHALWVAALAMLFGGCASDNEPTSPADKDTDSPQELTFTAATPDDDSSQTRVAYDETNLKLTWEGGDKLLMAGFNDENQYINKEEYTYQGVPGATSGDFTGKEVDGATKYTAYYPPTVDIIDSNVDFSWHLYGQEQSTNNNTAHLKNYMFMQATNITRGESFTLEMKSSIMKFVLTGIPDIGKLHKLIWVVETGDESKSLQLNFTDVTLNAGTNSLTAYLGFIPQDMVVKAGGNFSVILIGDNKAYMTQRNLANGKTYREGHRYIAEMNGEWKEMPQMQFTINIKKGGNSSSLPFIKNDDGIVPILADIIADWGDDRSESAFQLFSGVITSSLHTYSSAGEYTVTIYSTQTDATKEQIPPLSFISKKGIIRIDTPFLYTGQTSFARCFFGCSDLTSIPADMFVNNPQVTDFSYCFHNCTKLKLNPLIFGTKEGSNPPEEDTERFINMTEMNFSSCFYGVGVDVAEDAGTAPTLWEYTQKEGATWTTSNCFKNTSKLTNYGKIPQEWREAASSN